jgi:hypothetical protein
LDNTGGNAVSGLSEIMREHAIEALAGHTGETDDEDE